MTLKIRRNLEALESYLKGLHKKNVNCTVEIQLCEGYGWNNVLSGNDWKYDLIICDDFPYMEGIYRKQMEKD